MNQQVKRLVERAGAAFGALGLGTALTVVSLLAPNAQLASALTVQGGQIQSRAIYMSSSTPSATGQTYLVTFKPASSTPIASLILDFCGESPIVGDPTCTAPDSTATTPTFNIGGASPTVTFAGTTVAGGDPIDTTGLPAGTGAWTATGINNVGSNYRTLKLTNSTNSGTLDNSGATTYSFLISGVTNPAEIPGTTNTGPASFYARILTYTTTSGDVTHYAPGDEDHSGASTDLQDYGGVALSTTNNVNITAKVQETLAFCVTSVDLGATGNQCGDSVATDPANIPNLNIGHGGGSVKVIDNSQIDTATAYMQLSTNATTGAVIRMHSTNSCSNAVNGVTGNAGLSSNGGTTCNIPGADNTTAGPLVLAVPNPAAYGAFGLYVGNGYATTGLSSSTSFIAADTNYHHNGDTTEPATPGDPLTALNDLWFGMDNTASSGVGGTYGDVIANTGNHATNTDNAHLVFGAVASLTTPAGIYTGGESLIATGTF